MGYKIGLKCNYSFRHVLFRNTPYLCIFTRQRSSNGFFPDSGWNQCAYCSCTFNACTNEQNKTQINIHNDTCIHLHPLQTHVNIVPFLMIPSSLYIKVYIWSYDQMYHTFSYYFLYTCYFSSLNLKYLNLTKMDITRFAMNLFKYCYT